MSTGTLVGMTYATLYSNRQSRGSCSLLAAVQATNRSVMRWRDHIKVLFLLDKSLAETILPAEEHQHHMNGAPSKKQDETNLEGAGGSSSRSSNTSNFEDVDEENLREKCLSITPLIWRNFIDVGRNNHSFFRLRPKK